MCVLVKCAVKIKTRVQFWRDVCDGSWERVEITSSMYGWIGVKKCHDSGGQGKRCVMNLTGLFQFKDTGPERNPKKDVFEVNSNQGYLLIPSLLFRNRAPRTLVLTLQILKNEKRMCSLKIKSRESFLRNQNQPSSEKNSIPSAFSSKFICFQIRPN